MEVQEKSYRENIVQLQEKMEKERENLLRQQERMLKHKLMVSLDSACTVVNPDFAQYLPSSGGGAEGITGSQEP